MSNTTESVSRHGLPRSSLACLACRNAKSKCDGMIPSVIITTRSEIPHPSFDVHAEVDCSRCARLGIECKWRPCQRTGRPTKKRKLSLESQQWSENNDQNHINSNQDDIILDNMLFSDDSIRMISDLLEDDFILRDQTVSLSNESNQSQSPGNQMVEIQKRIHDISSPKQPSLDHPNHLMPLTHSTITTNNTLHQGISRFFTGVGIAIPLFESKGEIMKESEYCDALLYAAAALGHALYEGHESLSSTTTRKEAIEKINASIFTHTLDRHASIVSLSALILMIYIAYAMNDTLALQIYIDQARTSALALNLQENDGNDLQKAEFAKKVWWELYVIDCIMDVMTNGKIKRQFDGIRINVEFPGKGKDMQHVWDLRVRSVSLLAGTFTHFVKSKDEEKLWAADKIQANIIAEAQGMLLSAMQARLAGNTDWTLNRKQTILFDCLMMLYAGRIHLHRLFWFEDLTLNLDSCSFKREKINDISQGSQEPLKISTGSITSSVEKIAQSSDAILHLMQMDTDAFFKQSLSLMQSQVDLTKETLPITSSHWPPIGCCQMVASFGLAVHMASKGTEDELRAQQSVSSIGMAEASLGILSKVWPVAEYYRQELHQCRLLISQSISNK